jgi:shikimate kinase
VDSRGSFNIVLVGFMGTGKSAVGRSLARRLRRRFVDTDQWIRCEAGMTIPEIFERFGEQAFRDLETEAARAVSHLRRAVVSTGGGMLGRDENVELLRAGGVLINLQARPEVILERTAPWEGRPMLKTAPDPRQAVEQLLAARAPRYALADWTLDTSDMQIEEVVDQICEKLPSLSRIARTPS